MLSTISVNSFKAYIYPTKLIFPLFEQDKQNLLLILYFLKGPNK